MQPAGPHSRYCPACERYTAAAAACPYCGCDAHLLPLRRALRWAAVAFALGGLAILHGSAGEREPPCVRLCDITPAMHRATVSVTGIVATAPYIGRRGADVDYISWMIADGARGRLRIRAHDDVARALNSEARMPTRGDRVTARGVLRAETDGGHGLRLRSAGDLRVGFSAPVAAPREAP